WALAARLQLEGLPTLKVRPPEGGKAAGRWLLKPVRGTGGFGIQVLGGAGTARASGVSFFAKPEGGAPSAVSCAVARSGHRLRTPSRGVAAVGRLHVVARCAVPLLRQPRPPGLAAAVADGAGAPRRRPDRRVSLAWTLRRRFRAARQPSLAGGGQPALHGVRRNPRIRPGISGPRVAPPGVRGRRPRASRVAS